MAAACPSVETFPYGQAGIKRFEVLCHLLQKLFYVR